MNYSTHKHKEYSPEALANADPPRAGSSLEETSKPVYRCLAEEISPPEIIVILEPPPAPFTPRIPGRRYRSFYPRDDNDDEPPVSRSRFSS